MSGNYSVPPLPHVRGFPTLRVLPVSPTPTTASACLWMVHSACVLRLFEDHGGSPRFLCASFSIVPCSQTPPRSPVSSPLSGTYFCLPGFRPCRPSDNAIEAQSLHLHYGPNVALSTLNPCCYLHVSKTRFWVERLHSLPKREFHPLKAPGLSWRTKELFYISFNHIIYLTVLHIFNYFSHRLVTVSSWSKTIGFSVKFRLIYHV